jgi:hypothetical protein
VSQEVYKTIEGRNLERKAGNISINGKHMKCERAKKNIIRQFFNFNLASKDNAILLTYLLTEPSPS